MVSDPVGFPELQRQPDIGSVLSALTFSMLSVGPGSIESTPLNRGKSAAFERLVNIGDDIVYVFNADRQPHEVFCYTGGFEFRGT